MVVPMAKRLLHPRPSAAERRLAWTTLYDGATEAPQHVSRHDLLDVLTRALQTHRSLDGEATPVWLKDWSPTLRTEAIWTVFAAFGLPRRHFNYLEWINTLPDYATSDPEFAGTLPMPGLDVFIYWLWRGEKWSQGFWAMKVADGTMLIVVNRLRDLLLAEEVERHDAASKI